VPIGLGAFGQVGPAVFLVRWCAGRDGRFSPELVFLLGIALLGAVTFPLAYAWDRLTGAPKAPEDAP
jgi:hypothetical protein